MRETAKRRGDEIDLLKLFSAYFRRWWLIVLCGALIAAGTWVFSTRVITPLYRAGVTVYVNNSSSSERIDYISSGNLTVSKQLVSTYVNIISSDTVLEKVIASAGLNCTAKELREMLSSKQVADTEMFQVFILHPDAEQAAYIANAIADVAPTVIEDIVEGSSTKIIDRAKVPEQQYSPNVMKNTAIGGLIGVLIAVIYLTVFYLLDVRVKDEEDLTAIADYPVLGQIPEFSQLGSRSGKYGYGYGKRSSKKTDGKTEEEGA